MSNAGAPTGTSVTADQACASLASLFHARTGGAEIVQGGHGVDVIGACVRTPAGVFGIVPTAGTSVEESRQYSRPIFLEVVFFPLDPPSGQDHVSMDLVEPVSPGTSENPTMTVAWFDYDGDGLPEVFISLDKRDDAEDDGPCVPFGGRHWGWLLTVHRATDAPGMLVLESDARRPGGAMMAMVDSDLDGRPDLITTDPYTLDDATSVCSEDAAPHLLAHSLPSGRFSRDDAAARAFARTECPAPSGPHLFDTLSLRAVACARLWGISTGALQTEIHRQCAGRRPRGAHRPGECDDAVLARAVSLPPPFVLHASPRVGDAPTPRRTPHERASATRSVPSAR